jgi:hypothetical protein
MHMASLRVCTSGQYLLIDRSVWEKGVLGRKDDNKGLDKEEQKASDDVMIR